MRPKLSGNIIFVFSDPGGAKPCLALMEENNLFSSLAISDRYYSFYDDFSCKVRFMDQGFENLIETLNPDIIFTATSYRSDIERKFIRIAKNNKISCYSFVDHWTSISNRFADSEGFVVLPDFIWLIDERAKMIAIEEGIEESKIVVSGNPYHDWLRKWKPIISKSEFFSSIDQLQSKKLLVYAPDPLSNVNGMQKFGFDELSATSILVDIIKNHREKLLEWTVLLKMHPNQNKNEILKYIPDWFYILPDEISTNNVIYFADVVVGFFSSFLIEASIMNTPVIRFLEGSLKIDPIAELNIGRISNRNNFIEMLYELE